MTLAIDVKGLRKTYRVATGGVQEALRGVDLEVQSHELFGFVGVNGAGKSTLIKSLVGLLRPSAGEARIFGVPAGTTQARSQLGYLPEVSNYHEFLSAQELLGIHASLAGVPSGQRQDRCHEALQAVGLGTRMKTRISEFSKGMKQRFGIAQAMVAKPPLLIFDELTSGLDPLAQRELKHILLELRQQGTTIFFSSHHMSEVEAVCDRVAILHRGRIRAQGRLGELLTRPEVIQARARLSAEAQALIASQISGEGVGTWAASTGAPEEGSINLPRARVNEFLDFLRHHQGDLLYLSPSQVPLEDFYFEVVQAADREEGTAS